MTGINYPWTTIRGAANYGCDFGANVWGSHTGVTAHTDDVRRDLHEMAAIGVEVVRWFVFTDGRGGARWDPAGRLAGLSDGFFADMDTALEIALDAGIGLCLVLFDYSWMLHREVRDATGARLFVTRPDLIATREGLPQVIDRLIEPLLDHYGMGGPRAVLGRAIHSIDVMNEPDWVTEELAPTRERDVTGRRRLQRPFSLPELRALVRAVADRVHATTEAMVTVGGGRVRFAREWDDAAYGLDFVQVHSYPDVRHPRRDLCLIDRACSSLGVSKPVLIGECPANGDRCHPPDHRPPSFELEDYLALARDAGYVGVWPWSFKGTDAFGAVDTVRMKEWFTSQVHSP